MRIQHEQKVGQSETSEHRTAHSHTHTHSLRVPFNVITFTTNIIGGSDDSQQARHIHILGAGKLPVMMCPWRCDKRFSFVGQKSARAPWRAYSITICVCVCSRTINPKTERAACARIITSHTSNTRTYAPASYSIYAAAYYVTHRIIVAFAPHTKHKQTRHMRVVCGCVVLVTPSKTACNQQVMFSLSHFPQRWLLERASEREREHERARLQNA